MSRRKGRRLGAPTRSERLRLGVVLAWARWRFWWRSPGDSALRPLAPTVPKLLEELRKSGGRRHIEDFGGHVFPYADDSELLDVEASDQEAVEWVHSLSSNARRARTFGGANGLAQWLSGIASALLCQPEVVVRILWNEERWRERGWARESPFYAHVLRPEGVELLGEGAYRIHPAEAHPSMRLGGSPNDEPYELPAEQTLVYRSAALSRGRLPLLEAAPDYLADRLGNQAAAAASYAEAAPEDTTLRAQLARMGAGRWQEPSRLARSRMARTLGSSLLEHSVYGSIYAPTTDYYLAWQHREVLRLAAAVRADLLAITATDLVGRALNRVGLEAEDVRLKPLNAPNNGDLDRAFEILTRGETDLWGFHDRTDWWTESKRRLQRHLEARAEQSES